MSEPAQRPLPPQQDALNTAVSVAVARERSLFRKRETAMVGAFVDLADGLLADFDVQDMLYRLSQHCVDLLEVTACGVMLTDGRSSLVVVSAYPPIGRVLDILQLQADEGPCLDCARSGQPVRSRDLAADTHRWPVWAPLALKEGFESVYATPLRCGDQIVGTLNLFGQAAATMTEQDLLVVRALADVAAITILQQRDATQAELLNTQLQAALASRISVEQAKGILAQSLRVDMDDAFAILRHNAHEQKTKLTVLAEGLVTGAVAPADLQLPAHEERR